MTVVLKDIDFKKRENNNYGQSNAEMYNLEEYRKISKKCISLFAENQMASRMLRDEDAISHVAEHVMWGHIRWRQDGGRTLKSYLNQCAIWAIKVWRSKTYQTEKKKIYSLNHQIDGKDSGKVEYVQITPDKKAKEPFDLIFNDKTKEALTSINSSCLTSLQSKCLYGRYIDGRKLQEIADELGVSRQAVNQHIKKGINKLRKENGIC